MKYTKIIIMMTLFTGITAFGAASSSSTSSSSSTRPKATYILTESQFAKILKGLDTLEEEIKDELKEMKDHANLIDVRIENIVDEATQEIQSVLSNLTEKQ